MAQIECDYCTKSFKSETGYLWHLDHLHSELVATHAQNPSRLADDEGHSPQNVEDYDSKWARESGPVEEEDSAGEEAILHELRELLPNLLEMMAKRREELERSKSVKIDVDGLNRKLTTIEASVATIERKLNRLEKVIKALSRLVTHVDMQLKPKEFVDVFVEGLEPEALTRVANARIKDLRAAHSMRCALDRYVQNRTFQIWPFGKFGSTAANSWVTI